MFQQVALQSLSAARAQEISQSTLFGSLQWLSLWESLGGTPVLFQSLAELQANNNMSFSALRFGASLLSRTQAHIDGLPGLLLTPDLTQPTADIQRVSDETRNNVLQVLGRVSGLYAHWVDYYGQFSVEKLPSGWEVFAAETKRIPLTGGAPTARENVTRHIASGKRNGAVLRRAQSVEDARATYALAKLTHERYARSRTYPPEIYERLLELSLEDDRVIWLICESAGNIIGAHIALHERDTVISWAPYMDREAKELKPAYVLLDKIITVASERGAAFVNLGVTPSGAEGVERFKSRFGAESYTYRVFVYRSRLARALGKGTIS